MSRISLRDIKIPDLGLPSKEPEVPKEDYEERILNLRAVMKSKKLDAILVYGDPGHVSNIAFLSGYDPRFEEAALVIRKDGPPQLLVGNEGVGYAEAAVRIAVETHLVQSFSLMGQPRKAKEPVQFLRETGLKRDMKVGVVGWKYFTNKDFRAPRKALEIPSYLVDSLRRIVGPSGIIWNATELLMDPTIGLRSSHSVHDIASFEFAATSLSQSMQNMIEGLREGLTEYEAVQLMKLNGLPLASYVCVSTGPRARYGLCSPSMRTIKRGDPLSASVGLRGSCVTRAAYVVESEDELKNIQPNYLSEVCIPYFELMLRWYESVKIGVQCDRVYRAVQDHLRAVGLELTLNPGHMIDLEEWSNSPFYAGSSDRLKSGMAIQADMILRMPKDKFGVNVEDTVVLADENLRESLHREYPEAFKRIQRRREFMADTLGLNLDPEIMPLCNASSVLRPFLLSKNKALVKE